MSDAMMAAINAAAAPAPSEAPEMLPAEALAAAKESKPSGRDAGAGDNRDHGGRSKRDGATALSGDVEKSDSIHEPESKEKGKSKFRLGDRELDLSDEDIRELTKRIKYKVKVDGKQDEVDIDKLVKSYQLEQASQKRMQDAAAYRKHAEILNNLVDNIKQNPKTLLELAKTLGHDPLKIAEDALFEKFQYDSMSPEQRKVVEMERELSELKSQREFSLKETEEHQVRAQEEQALQDLDNELSELFDEMQGKLDRDDIELTVTLLKNSLESGRDISVRDAHKQVQALFDRKFQARLKGLSAEEIKSLVPAETFEKFEKLRASDAAQAQAKMDPFRRKRAQAAAPEGIVNRKPTEKNRPTFDEIFKELGV